MIERSEEGVVIRKCDRCGKKGEGFFGAVLPLRQLKVDRPIVRLCGDCREGLEEWWVIGEPKQYIEIPEPTSWGTKCVEGEG